MCLPTNMRFIALALAAIPLVSGHGVISDPPSRQAGAAMQAACGQQVFNQQKSDNAGNIQGELQVAQSQKDYNPAQCNLFLCKGFQFQDNSANVQTYTAGQQVPIKIDIRAPHTGTANVSIVDTKANAIIQTPLITFTDYASNAHPIPATDKAFTITMPDLAGKCAQPGNCVVQWWWNAADIKQTYEGCVDFTQGGGAGAAPAKLRPRQDTVVSNFPPSTMTIVPAPASSSDSGSSPTGTSGSSPSSGSSLSSGSSPTSGSSPSSSAKRTKSRTPTASSVPSSSAALNSATRKSHKQVGTK
jgi:hypothetical protein